MPNRFICTVLDEMRACHKTRNYSGLMGLIEEAQSLASRMEAGLQERKDYLTWHKRCKEEKAAYKTLLAKTNKLRKKAGEDQKEAPHYP